MNCDNPNIRKVDTIIFLLMLSLFANAQPDFTASETSGCTPLNIKFAIDPSTVDMDTITSIGWNFGNGVTSSAINPDTVTYEDEGEYTVTMVVNGYTSETVTKTDYILVHRTVNASFRYEEYALNYNYRFIPLDVITDTGATYFYNWRYENLTVSDTRYNEYIVDIDNQEDAIDSITLDTGIYLVTLRVEDTFGCLSRSDVTLYISTEVRIPNVFIPENEQFFIIDPANQITVLRFEVYNRYGTLIFSQTAPIINWDGKNNAGQDLNTGVYYYMLQSVEGDINARYNQTGFIHLYR